MLKTVAMIALAIAALAILGVAVLIAGTWWLGRKQPPAHALIVEKYYACPHRRALHGGIFGKGPSKVLFPPDAPQWCWRDDWQEVSREEFKRLATQWHGVDWSSEGEWWARE